MDCVFAGLKSLWQIFRSSQESMLLLVTWRHSKQHTPPSNLITPMSCGELSSYDKVVLHTKYCIKKFVIFGNDSDQGIKSDLIFDLPPIIGSTLD